MPGNIDDDYNYHYGIIKMDANLFDNNPDYRNKLNFWKMLEKRYFLQRQKWLKVNSQMLAAKAASERARKFYEIENRNQPEEIDKEDDDDGEEFSDVDQDGFADPGAQYYSSLDAQALQKVKDDLTTIHLKHDSETNTDSRGTYRRLIWVINFLIIILCVAAYWLLKVMTKVDKTTEVQTCPGCINDVDVPLRGLLNALFPQSNENDEI